MEQPVEMPDPAFLQQHAPSLDLIEQFFVRQEWKYDRLEDRIVSIWPGYELNCQVSEQGIVLITGRLGQAYSFDRWLTLVEACQEWTRQQLVTKAWPSLGIGEVADEATPDERTLAPFVVVEVAVEAPARAGISLLQLSDLFGWEHNAIAAFRGVLEQRLGPLPE